MKSYREFMAERQPELRAQGLSQGEAMRQIGEEWKAYKANQGTSPDQAEPPKRKRGRPRKKQEEKVKESKLTGMARLQSLRLEVPYLVEARPDVAAAWDVAEGILDYLFENAAGIDESEAFERRALATYARAKGGTSQADMTEYELGQSLGETLLLVMAQRRVSAADWIGMVPPQLAAGELLPVEEEEEQGIIDSGLEMLGLKDPESVSSKAVEKAKDIAKDKAAQTVLDLLQ